MCVCLQVLQEEEGEGVWLFLHLAPGGPGPRCSRSCWRPACAGYRVRRPGHLHPGGCGGRGGQCHGHHWGWLIRWRTALCRHCAICGSWIVWNKCKYVKTTYLLIDIYCSKVQSSSSDQVVVITWSRMPGLSPSWGHSGEWTRAPRPSCCSPRWSCGGRGSGGWGPSLFSSSSAWCSEH